MVSLSLSTTATATVATIALLTATPTHGHGLLMKPKPTFKAGASESSYTGTILGNVAYPGSAFNGEWKDNIATFTQRFKSDTRHPDLKTLIAKNQKLFADGIADATCGYTDPSKSREVLEGDTITYGRYIEGKREGFVHPGPCETWCDNNLVQQDMDCMSKYKAPYGTPSVLPIDAAKCKGAKQLSFYWLGIQNNEWQIYINCVGLSGAASGSPTPAGNSTASTASPVPASGTDDDEYANNSTATPKAAIPKAATSAPTKSPKAPSAPASSSNAAKTPMPTLPSSKCMAKATRQLVRKQQ